MEGLLGSEAFTEDIYRKIWKGLFYSSQNPTTTTIITSLAMWSADKVKFQNELAERIAKLVHIIGQFGSDGFSAWLSAALFIIDNEWNKIDYWRMNKFLKLVKFVLKESI